MEDVWCYGDGFHIANRQFSGVRATSLEWYLIRDGAFHCLSSTDPSLFDPMAEQYDDTTLVSFLFITAGRIMMA